MGGDFCGDCPSFPCERLRNLDKRYRTKYGVSAIENLREIKTLGVDVFLEREKSKWRCAGCGATLCMHETACLACQRPRLQIKQ